MSVESELRLLKEVGIYFEKGTGNVELLISDLGDIIEMTSMMMTNDNMWDYTINLSSNEQIWKTLENILKNILNKKSITYGLDELRLVKGSILMIRNLLITFGKMSSEKELRNLDLELVRNIGQFYISEDKKNVDKDIVLKRLDISIVCFHCAFNYMQSNLKMKNNIKDDLNLLNNILVYLQEDGEVFDMRQIMPQFKAYCMIHESREIITDNECEIFINFIIALVNVLNFDVFTDIQDLKDTAEDKYKLIIELAHILVYLFQDEKIGISMFKTEKTGCNENIIIFFLVACQMTFSMTDSELEEEWKWDYIALGSIFLDFFKIYREKCIELLELKQGWNKDKEAELNIQHRKMISILDIITNLLPYELFKKTLNSYDFLKDLIQLLHVIENNTERKRLKDTSELRIYKKTFPHAKTIIIEIITYLVHSDIENQNKVREYGGLILILNNCNLDVNEPFIRERCILCLKYLLENNYENQSFIASLEAKGFEINKQSEKVLEKCGYEVEIVDGKVQLKKQPVFEEINNK